MRNDDIIEIKIRRQGVDWLTFKRIMLNLVTPFPEHTEAKQLELEKKDIRVRRLHQGR